MVNLPGVIVLHSSIQLIRLETALLAVTSHFTLWIKLTRVSIDILKPNTLKCMTILESKQCPFIHLSKQSSMTRSPMSLRT